MGQVTFSKHTANGSPDRSATQWAGPSTPEESPLQEVPLHLSQEQKQWVPKKARIRRGPESWPEPPQEAVDKKSVPSDTGSGVLIPGTAHGQQQATLVSPYTSLRSGREPH